MSVLRRLTNVARGKVKEWQRAWRDGPQKDEPVEEPVRKPPPPVGEPPKRRSPLEEPTTEEVPVKEPGPTPKKRRL